MILSNISLLGNVPCYSVEEVLRARPWGDRGNIQLVLFLGASLCLPNKKVRLNLEENLKDLPTLVGTSAKEAISDSQSELWHHVVHDARLWEYQGSARGFSINVNLVVHLQGGR